MADIIRAQKCINKKYTFNQIIYTSILRLEYCHLMKKYKQMEVDWSCPNFYQQKYCK